MEATSHVKPRDSMIHVFLVSFPGQGHVNPMLRLGKLLAAKGFLVTVSTAKYFAKFIKAANETPEGETPTIGDGFLRFEFYDDGFELEDSRLADSQIFLSQIELAGKSSLPGFVQSQNHRVSCIVSNPFIPWASDVAEELGIPCAVLWVQSCAVFATYYHHFHRTVPFPTEDDLTASVELPGCTDVLKHDEIPTFLNPKCRFTNFGRVILRQFRNLSKAFCVLADTFEELESELLVDISRFCPVKPVGPMFRAAKDWTGPAAADEEGCLEWLDGKPAATVVYISFGTVVHLPQDQVDEIAHGLLSSGVSFLWVMKRPAPESGLQPHVLPEGFMEEAREKGKVVAKWVPQEEVLNHQAVSCFLTHCGWNSTMEALASGVPVVALPQWGDQATNAKFLVDVYGVGVRLGRGEISGGVPGREEVARCLLEATVGEKAVEMRRNAAKWKMAAADAVAEGGSSHRSLAEFMNEIERRSCGAAGVRS